MSDIGQVEDLERGYPGTAKTISKMWKLVQKGKLDPVIQKQAHQIVLHSDVDARTSNRALADAIFSFVKGSGLFVRDPFQVETISTPEVMREAVSESKANGSYAGSKIFSADCDGYSVYFLSLAGALGFQGAFETTINDPDRPDEFSHVYPALLVDGNWIAYDASTPESNPGWRPPSPSMKRWHESPIESEIGGKQWIKNSVEEIRDMTGMSGGLGYGYGGGSYWGTGQPSFVQSPENQPLMLPPNPGESSLLVPSQPAPHRASAEVLSPDDDWLYNPESPLMRGTQSLAERSEGIMTLPMEQPYNYPYYQDPVPGVSVRDGFPPGWPWSYQVTIEPATEVEILENEDPSMTASQADALPAGMGGDCGMGYQVNILPPSFGPEYWEQEEIKEPLEEAWKAEQYIQQYKKDQEGKDTDKDDEDEGGLIKSVGEMFSGLFTTLPGVATTYGSHYLKQQEGELALQIQQAKTEAEKARANAEYQKAMGKRYEGGHGNGKNGLPSWVLPVGIGGAVLLIGGAVLLKR